MTVLTNCQESSSEKFVSSQEVILNMVLNSSTPGSNGSAVSYGIRPPDSMMTASLLHHFPVPSVGPSLVSSRTTIDQTTSNSSHHHHHHPSRTAFGIQQLLGLGSAGGGGDDSSPGSRSSSASSTHHRPTPPNVGHGNCHESIGNIPTSSHSLVLPSSASSPLSSSSVFSRSPGSSSHYHQQHQSHSFPPTSSSSSSSVPSFLPSTMSSYLNSTTAAFMSATGHSGSHHPLSMSMFANSFPGSHVDNFSRSDVCSGKTFTGLYFVEIYFLFIQDFFL